MTHTPTDTHIVDIPTTNQVDEAAHGSYAAVLKNPTFLFLWLGQIASQLGDRIVFVIFVTLITAYYGDNDSYNSWLYIAFTIPAICLTAIAGVFVDRWPRQRVLVVTNLIRAAVVAVLPVLAPLGLLAIYTEAFAISAATQFFVPAESATIPAIVEKQNLIQANALFTTTMMASVIFGFALGDPLIEQFGLDNVHWAIVGLFIVAALLLTRVTIPKKEVAEHTNNHSSISNEIKAVFTELAEGWQYLISHPNLFRLMAQLAVVFSALVALCILFITFAKQYLYEDPNVAVRKFAYIISVSGIGLAGGALLASPLSKKMAENKLIATGLITCGIFLGLLLFTPTLANTPWADWPFIITDRIGWTYLLSLLMGTSAALAAIPLQTAIHQAIEPAMRGKMMGIQFTLLSTSSTLPIVIAGLGVTVIGLPPMLLAIAVLLAATGLWSLRRP